MDFLRSKKTFQVIENSDSVLNHFTLKLVHQGSKQYQANFKVTDLGLKGLVQIVTSHSPVNVTVPEKKNILFLRFPPDLLVKGTRKIDAQALDAKTEEVLNTKEVTLLGPTH